MDIESDLFTLPKKKHIFVPEENCYFTFYFLAGIASRTLIFFWFPTAILYRMAAFFL